MILTLMLGLVVQDPQVTVVGDKPKKERKICKQVDGGTGSRLGGSRQCLTAAQWNASQAELDARDLNEINNQKGYNAGDYVKP